MSDNNELKRKYMQWCNDCPKAYDYTCSGADAKRCEAERKKRIFNERMKKQKPYVEKEPVHINPSWISVNEQLPDVSKGAVLCSTLTEISALTLWCKQGINGVEWTFISNIPYSGKVLYWLPLPQLPDGIWQK